MSETEVGHSKECLFPFYIFHSEFENLQLAASTAAICEHCELSKKLIGLRLTFFIKNIAIL